MTSAQSPFALPPEEAIRWFKQKGYALTFDYRELWGQQHARAFTVAKATQLDLLADIRSALERALKEGRTLAEFRRELTPGLQKRGWWGEQEVVDPATGETKLVQLGSASRLRTIYQTNMRQAQAAGRWERFQKTKDRRPYGRYVCLLDGRERAEHRAWHNTVLPLDHPWWEQHAPPNGWGCRCRMQQLSDRDLERFGLSVTKAIPEDVMRVYENERTGERVVVPKGIDPGFEYNPGSAPRAYVPGHKELDAPALSTSKTWRDEGLPSATELAKNPGLPAAAGRWRDVQTQADADRLYVELFGSGKPVEVADPDGMQVTFSPKILDHLIGRERDFARAEFLPRAKQTIEQPEEIWLVPHRITDPKSPQAGEVVLRKRYIGVFADRDVRQAVVAQRTEEGYAAWTTYPTRGVDSKRNGYLLYSRSRGGRAR